MKWAERPEDTQVERIAGKTYWRWPSSPLWGCRLRVGGVGEGMCENNVVGAGRMALSDRSTHREGVERERGSEGGGGG